MSIIVHVRYKDVEQVFEGNVDSVWTCVNRFFSITIPHFNAAQEVILTIDLKEIIELSKDLVAITDEGPVVLISKRKLTDSESLLLTLLAAYIGRHLGFIEKNWVSGKELQEKLGKSMKIVNTRLSELCREGYVIKSNEKNSFKLSTSGIKWLVEEVLPRIRRKI